MRLDKSTVTDAVKRTIELLEGIPESERSMSFPVVLSKILEAGDKKPDRASEVMMKTEAATEENFSGLTGGIRLLVREGFFKEGKTQNDIFEELKRQGYHSPKTSLPITLKGFMQKRILTRFKGDDKQYRYVEKK